MFIPVHLMDDLGGAVLNLRDIVGVDGGVGQDGGDAGVAQAGVQTPILLQLGPTPGKYINISGL